MYTTLFVKATAPTLEKKIEEGGNANLVSFPFFYMNMQKNKLSIQVFCFNMHAS
jgi:hypothetical protein